MKVHLLGQFLRGAAVVTSNHRGPATRKSQDSPWNFPHCTVTGEPRGSGGPERGPCQQHSSPPEGTTLNKTEAFSSCRPSLLPILWETALEGKTASYLPWLPSSNVFPRIQVSHSLSGSPSSNAGSPVASLMQAPSLLPRHRAAAATLQQGQRDVALPQSHASQPGRQVEEALGQADPALSGPKALMAIVLWVRDQPATE